MLFATCSIPAFAESNIDAYSDINIKSTFEFVSGTVPRTDEGDWIGGLYQGTVLKISNVDFGTYVPKMVYIYHAVPSSSYPNRRMDIAIDRADNVIGECVFNNGTGWTDFGKEPYEFRLTGNVEPGVHDIYFKIKDTGFGNFKSMRFDWKYEWITAPEINLTTAGDSAASDVSGAASIGATAAVDRNSGLNQTKKAALLLAQKDEKGTMQSLSEDEKGIADGGIKTEFTIPSSAKEDGATAAGAYFLYEDMTFVATGAKIGTPESAGDASATALNVAVDNGTVTVTGGNITDERVMIAAVETDYNTPIYKDALQLYEAEIVDGSFAYTYRMNSDIPSGQYKIIVKGNNTSLEKAFDYTSPTEIYNVLRSLAEETDVDTVIDTLSAKADLFNAERLIFETLGDEDKTAVNSKIKEYFASNPLEMVDDYSEWTSGVSNAIIPQSVVGFIKNSSDTDKICEYIERYAAVLGISDNQKYTKYYKDSKTEIAKAIKKLIVADATDEDFIAAFEEAVIVGNFNNAASWGYIDEGLTAFASDIPIEIGVYKKLINSVKQEMCNKFLNLTFATKEDVKGEFEENMDIYSQDESNFNNKYALAPSKVGNEIFTIGIFREKQEETEVVEVKRFEDIDSVPWAKESIEAMRDAGYVSGKSETVFAPNDSITREEFASILMRSLWIGTSDAQGLMFADVDKNAWYAGFIAAANNRGIVAGVTDTSFGVGQMITREQAAAMLQRSAAAVGKDILPKKASAAFTDSIHISDYAYDAVLELAKAEIISGMGNETFAPKKNITRAEATVLIMRFINNIK